MSHRRARHLNFAHAGADLALDSRFIAGSVGATVGTWYDRSANGRNATQGTEAQKPTIQVSTNGAQVLRFDGVDTVSVGDYMAVNHVSDFATKTILIAYKLATSEPYTAMFACRNAFSDKVSVSNEYNAIGVIPNSGANKVYGEPSGIDGAWLNGVSVSDLTSYRAYTAGVSLTDNVWNIISQTNPSSVSGAKNFTVSADTYSVSGRYTASDLGTICTFSTSLAAPLRRRIEQSMSLAYKIKWN